MTSINIKESYYFGHNYNNYKFNYQLKDIFNHNDYNITYSFIQGYCTNNAELIYNKKYILYINNIKDELLKILYEYILNKLNTKCIIDNNKILIININIIDFLYILFKDNDERELIHNKLYNYYKLLSNYYNINNNQFIINIPHCKYHIIDDNAIIPTKAHGSDVGYDLSIIKLIKQTGTNTYLYDTGIIVIPDIGYYFEIIGRSSLSKSGYIITNSVGIIDPSYSNTLLISLTKIDIYRPNLKLPFKCAQLIIRKFINYHLTETKDSLDDTSRGIGGFGSTNTD